MREFDAFHGYPQPKEQRVIGPELRKIENRIIASERGREFYDGDRTNGYGGMKDDGRWGPIADNLIKDYNLVEGSKILQLNAHKGFLLNELYKRGMRVWGTEISQYAIEHSTVRMTYAPFTQLPFDKGAFDFVIAASAVYSLNLPDAIQCLREIQRVGKGQSWITLAAMEDEYDIEGLKYLRWWFLLGTTILTKADWIAVMKHAGYTGDYRFDTARYLFLVPSLASWSRPPETYEQYVARRMKESFEMYGP